MDISPKWAPDASALFYVSNQGGGLDVYRQAVSKTGEAIGPPDRLTVGKNLHSLDLSKDGLHMVVSEHDYRQNIWASELEPDQTASGRDAIQITSGNQVIESIAISPDDTRLAYDSNARGPSHLYVVPLAGGLPFQITSRGESVYLYDWSPYSEQLSFHTFSEGFRNIGIVSEDGLKLETVSDDPIDNMYPFWLGDKNTIAYHLFAPVEGEFHLVQRRRNSSGEWSEPDVLIENMRLGAQWSTARNQLTYFSGKNLFVWDPETGESRSIAAEFIEALFSSDERIGARIPIWSRDGRTIYFKSYNDRGGESFWAVRTDGRTPREIVDLTGAEAGIGASAVDDQRIYYTILEIESDIWVLDLAR